MMVNRRIYQSQKTVALSEGGSVGYAQLWLLSITLRLVEKSVLLNPYCACSITSKRAGRIGIGCT